MEDVIASRGFTNDSKEQLSFFVEQDGVNLFLTIDCVYENGERELKFKVSPELLKELKIMFDVAHEESKDEFKNNDPLAFRNY
jgi:hypothetical protein